MYGLPFKNFPKVWVIAPNDFSSLNAIETKQAKDLKNLIEEHRNAIERELGSGFEFTDNVAIVGAKWLIGPSQCNPAVKVAKLTSASGPEITLDREKGLLVLDGRNPDEVMETLSYLRSLHRFKGGVWKIENCQSIDSAIETVFEEIKCSYPAFALRGLDWQRITDIHAPAIKTASDPIPEFQKWLAQLQDGHTWVRPFPPYGQFPYDLIVDGSTVKFYRIQKTSLAWSIGVRPGFELVTKGLEEWDERTGATSHSKPFVLGTRYLATKMGTKRSFEAKSPEGKVFRWEEEPVQNRWEPLVSRKKLVSGNGYLRIQLFLLDKNIEDEVDAAFEEFKDSPKLIVDLRGNPGGNLLMAHRIRNRFLDQDATVGWIQNTLPDGTLSEREPIYAFAASDRRRWLKPVVFLTDPLTYSAGEDVLLGLQGRPYVKVIGQPSGGGSGRMRLIRLLEGWRLTVSTALTYGLAGNCIEGSGIPVDEIHPISFDEEELIKIADELRWRHDV